MPDFVIEINTPKISITTNNYLCINNSLGLTFNDEIIKQLLVFTNNSLSLKFAAYELFDNIPSNITKLCIDFMNYDDVNIDNLHNGLKELHILSEAEGHFNKPINNLPQTLETLYIVSYNFNQSLNYLPCSLKNLYIESKAFECCLDNLPSNLETLTITTYYEPCCKTITTDNFMNLPNALKTLNISKKYNLDINLINDRYPNLHVNIHEVASLRL
jgi:hypothetical protein